LDIDKPIPDLWFGFPGMLNIDKTHKLSHSDITKWRDVAITHLDPHKACKAVHKLLHADGMNRRWSVDYFDISKPQKHFFGTL
jgi:hypothetical protein